MSVLDILDDINEESKLLIESGKPFKLWMPKRVVFTADAIKEPYGQQIYERVQALNLPTEIATNNRITGLRGKDERETYRIAKNTLAIVNAPPSAFNLRPIPPSADWQFHLAEGCPAHCQYCYLAGSLSGPPAIRVFANLPQILQNTIRFQRLNQVVSYEASCYTDPLSLEHLTGGLKETISFFAGQPNVHLRFVTKFNNVDSLIGLNHNGKTRFRCSLNAEVVAKRLEGGTPPIPSRLAGLRSMALPKSLGGGGYPIGIVLAPIMPIPDWEIHYTQLLDDIQSHLDFETDLTFELITHRFTPGSRDVLLGWYPNTSLDFGEENREIKRNKFGGQKYVFVKELMTQLKAFFEKEVSRRFPKAKVLYWT
ncbi:MAG: spore photoproduct lyase family protein [Pedobacter sp.]